MGKGKKGGLIFGMKNNSICNLLKRTRDVKLIIYLGGIYSREGAGGLLKGFYGIRLLLPARIKPLFKLEKNYTKSPNGNKFSRLS